MTKYSSAALGAPRNFAEGLNPVAPENTAKKLVSFSVTSDSVVATASLVFEDSHEFVTIHWGDDQHDQIDLRKERIVRANPDSANTVSIQHVYDEDSLLSRTLVVAVTRDKAGKKSLDAQSIEVRPRYKFVHYPVIFEISSHHDTIFETHSEFDIFLVLKQDDQKIIDKQWNLNVHTAGGITQPVPGLPISMPLDDSHFFVEMEVTDAPILYDFQVFEDDGGVWGGIKGFFDFITDIPAEFDTSVRVLRVVHPDEFQGLLEYSVNYPLDDGTVRAHFSMEMNLISPVDRSVAEVLAPV